MFKYHEKLYTESPNTIILLDVDPKTMKMDNGFTEHSGCPVVEGEKKIVTQWVRYGVDKEHPWNSFNTLGIPIDKMAELEQM